MCSKNDRPVIRRAVHGLQGDDSMLMANQRFVHPLLLNWTLLP